MRDLRSKPEGELDVCHVEIGKRLSVGQEGTFTKEELVSHVEEEDNVGKKIIEIQLEYLRALGKGKILDE